MGTKENIVNTQFYPTFFYYYCEYLILSQFLLLLILILFFYLLYNSIKKLKKIWKSKILKM